MSESKRFTYDKPIVAFSKGGINDNVTGETYEFTMDTVLDLLNEQCELIEELHDSDHMGWGRAEKFEKELKQKKIYIKRLEYKVQKFKEMNNEQQATISQSREMNGQLREINKELGDDLYNCRLNKNIISEKLKLWQDTLAEYDIYTIKDFVESFELDAELSKEKDEKIKELEVKVLNLELEIKRLEKMIWKIQWRFQQEVGIEKAMEHYREIDKEMNE